MVYDRQWPKKMSEKNGLSTFDELILSAKLSLFTPRDAHREIREFLRS